MEQLKKIGLFSATMLVVGSIIGSGIFKKVAPMSLKLGSMELVLLCWVLAGIITFLGALSFAEVGASLAATGGLYAYLRELYGRFVAYLFGWSCFAVIQTASISSIAYVFAESFVRIFGFGDARVVACICIGVLTIINYLGLVFGALITNFLTILKLLGIGLIIFLGVTTKSELVAASTEVIPSINFSIAAIFSAMLSAFWAYDGINNVAYIGGEIKDAKRNIPLALGMGVGIVILVYLLCNFAFFQALPFGNVIEIAKKPGSVFAIEMLREIKGEDWAKFVAILIMASTLGTTNSSILTSARIYYAMARDGLAHQVFGHLNPRFLTPSFSLLAQGVWAMGLIYLGSFDELTDMLIFASFIFYGLGAGGIFILRRRKGPVPNFQTNLAVPVIYCLFSLTLVVVTLINDPINTLKGLGLMAIGIPFYFLQNNSRLGFRKL